MSDTKPAFVFVHGAWFGNSVWRSTTTLLEERGYVCRALDLPGSGANAKVPLAYGHRPLDAAAFATEPSPNAHVTQEERTQAVVSLVEKTARETGAPVVLVGHSLGGLTVTAVAEAIPDRLSAVAYVCAFLPSPGVSAMDLLQHPTMAETLVPSLFLADHQTVRALRIDTRSDDAEYLARMRNAFCADTGEADFSAALASAHCDEPAGVMLAPARLTAERFGRAPRHYIRCLEDRAIPLTAQDFMVAAADSALGSQTQVHTLAASHFPFYSQTRALADILLAVGA